MDIALTPYLWLNLLLLGLLLGAGWTLGVLIVNAVLGLIRRIGKSE